MPEYRRVRVPGGTYFFTVNLHDRRASLLVDHVESLRRAVGRVHRCHPFHIDAWVVLPDHMHCIWTLPEGDDRFSERWRLIKLLFVKALPTVERATGAARTGSGAGIWQPRFWEHAILGDRDYANHFDYVHFNPVKHGHVSRVRDWPYSTFHRYVRHDVLPLDWAGDVGELSTARE